MRMRTITVSVSTAVLLLASGCGSDGSAGEEAGAAPAGATASQSPSTGSSTGPSTGTSPGPAGHGSGHNASVAAPKTAALRTGESFQTLTMPEPYAPKPPNGGTDEYRCFLLDPKLTDRVFLTGTQFLPQNPDIVHHAIFFRASPQEARQAEQVDAKAPGEGWTCFSGTGVGDAGAGGQLRGGSSWLGAWAPGGREVLSKARVGYEMTPGTRIIMQVHYNLLATDGKAAGTDRSAIRLRMSRDGDFEKLESQLLPAPVELPCPAGETGPLCDREQSVLDVWKRFGKPAAASVSGLNLLCNGGRPPVGGTTTRCDRTIQQAGTVYAVAGHMHLLGTSIKVELNPGTPGARTLLDVPVYNFDDQGARMLAQPVSVKPGDTYRVTCTHDAGLRRRLPELRKLPPRYVVWGEGTSDEMCLGTVTVAPKG